MNDLTITWKTLLEIGAGLIIFFQVGKWLINFGNPIVKLKERVDDHDKFFANDKAHLDKVDKSIQQIDEGLGVLGLAIAELMNHEISGNDVQKLREQKDKVETYFYGRKGENNE